jgi:hypothetical protein
VGTEDRAESVRLVRTAPDGVGDTPVRDKVGAARASVLEELGDARAEFGVGEGVRSHLVSAECLLPLVGEFAAPADRFGEPLGFFERASGGQGLGQLVDGEGPRCVVFAGPKGGPARRSNFQKHWSVALATAGVTGVHFHDLRHTGNTLAAQAGATLPDLMARMGHASPRAARIYLHTTSDRDRVVANALDRLIPPPDGTLEENGHAAGTGRGGEDEDRGRTEAGNARDLR